MTNFLNYTIIKNFDRLLLYQGQVHVCRILSKIFKSDIKSSAHIKCYRYQNFSPTLKKEPTNCQSIDILTIFTCINPCISCYERNITFTLLRIRVITCSMHYNIWRFTRIFFLALLHVTSIVLFVLFNTFASILSYDHFFV